MVDIVDKALRMGEGHQLKKLENVAKAVNALEDEISALSDEELKGQTAKFKQRLDNGENLDKLMPEAFATVREVSKRIASGTEQSAFICQSDGKGRRGGNCLDIAPIIAISLSVIVTDI